ncbi:MAG: YdeI/OmpD-associated family protein [Gemmatimonadaceae bacterium]
MDATYFTSPADFRAWLAAHHDSSDELVVGFHGEGSGTPSMSWPEAVDEALCHGWIDGVRRRVDDTRYTIRFTPRRPRSTWSAVNVARVAALTAEGRMQPAGLAAFDRRAPERTGTYAYEQRREAALDPDQEAIFRDAEAAWEFFQSRPASYRRTLTWWVVSAKRAETRRRRLDTLVAACADGRMLR